MSEDEAFIRKIVDSPGDDLPRLVYADWLDERGDARGAYLRAEVEWAMTKQTTGFLVFRLHGLAEGLDPVWVARVSRPPLGVCVEHLFASFRDDGFGQGPTLAAVDLDAFEAKLGVTLPTEYRALLLNHNGCPVLGEPTINIPAAVHPDSPHPSNTEYEVGDFQTVPPKDGVSTGYTPHDEVWMQPDDLGDMLYIADDGIIAGTAGYYLGVSGDRRGRIFYYHKHLDVSFPFVAPALGQFLAAIKPPKRRKRS